MLPDNLQCESHEPYGPRASLTWLQLLPKKNTGGFTALLAETHWFARTLHQPRLITLPALKTGDSWNYSYITFSDYQLNAKFLYFSTICMLHYAPQHVSSSTLLILRRTNCITTAPGIVTFSKQPYRLHTVWLLTEGDDTRSCGDTICPPEDEQRAARNMLRSVV